MKPDVRIIFIITAFVLSACSGDYSTGTGMQNTLPPVGSSSMPYPGPNAAASTAPKNSAISSKPGVSVYALSDAQTGFTCPDTTDGYGCKIQLNVPLPAPSTKGKKRATPTPSPTPTPTPTPSPQPTGSDGTEASATPSPTPTPAGPTMTLHASALPKDAPKMDHAPADSLDVIPLMMVSLTPSADFVLDGAAIAQYSLPKTQTDGRGFALQIFQQTTHKKHTDYKFLWSYNKSTLHDTTLAFTLTPPKFTVGKGNTYTLVLYADDKAESPSPSPSLSPSPSGSPSPSPSPNAT